MPARMPVLQVRIVLSEDPSRAAAIPMTDRIRIVWPRGELCAQLHDTPTATALLAALPCQSRANTWGEEVYFSVPVDAALELDARQVVGLPVGRGQIARVALRPDARVARR